MLVNWIQEKQSVPVKMISIWKDITVLFDIIAGDMKHIYREGNGVADCYAKAGAN